ncbi:hypothetical protein N5D37_11520 [Comamonas aquatica]|jgi:phosphotransferase system HPr-like phosphotransfer protein|uniref:hypothetical protein n=1 Tax=Comamonas aquatica TaxID=225991 RepID=UPI002449D956|nr:hypothetical protein [Comamonas aquatica]MDH0494273.1 hypothetical protein [Comamonas aquatica]MDH1766279.1 hypothetical protein [Comamonas aquatica]
MGRTANKTQEPVTDVVLSTNAVARIEQTQDALAVEEQQMQARVRAIALQVGYQLPGDCIDADLIQRDIAANMRRSVEACLEVGRGLVALKAVCVHGSFVARLEVLGIEARVAQKFMQSAMKFSKASTSTLLKSVDSQSKLFEMLVLDDEQIDELALTGETGELKLDAIATMSVKELRSALRQSKEDNKFIAEKRDKEMQRADKLEKALKTGPKLQPLNERLADFMSASDKAHNEAASALLDLTQQAQALDAWWLEEATQMPGYDPEVITPMPLEVQAAAQKLYDGVVRLAANVNSLQQRLHDEYGHNLVQAA